MLYQLSYCGAVNIYRLTISNLVELDAIPAELLWGGKHISINDYKPSGARCYTSWTIVGRQTYIDKRLQT